MEEITDTTSSNKTIAKNTLLLYVRMLFNMLVGLYTSRVVLQVLGVEDYGVYNVVGGVVGMLGFLNSSMSGATSRFLTFELGKGIARRLSITFNSALVVHIGIALLFFVVAETFGLWFVCNKIVIPEGRMEAALWIYQFSILSAIVNIIQVPYNAAIIAHEKMDLWAYVEIVHTLLKLLIVYLLLISSYDKLIVYGALMLAVSLLIAMCYCFYSVCHFDEARFQLKVDKTIVKEMLSFSGYNLFGHIGSIFNRQGVTIIINNFFGVVFNAACGVATTVANIIASFANNIITVFRPPITKAYARNEMDKVNDLIVMALKLALYVLCLIAIPSMIEMKTLYNIWLVETPPGVVIFTRLIIIGFLFEIVRHIVTIAVHATGKVRYVSLANGILMTLNPIIVYIVFKLLHQVFLAFVCEIIMQMLLSLIVIFIAKHYVSRLALREIFLSVISILGMAVLSFFVSWFLIQHLSEGFMRLVITTLISCFLFTVACYTFSLNRSQRAATNSYVIHKIKQFKR